VQQALHANTPASVRALFEDQLFSLPTPLTPQQQQQWRAIEAALQGNSKPGRHLAPKRILGANTARNAAAAATPVKDTGVLARRGGYARGTQASAVQEA
jgi:hypothetical protein